MSYDLFFWNQDDNCTFLPEDVCALLLDGASFTGSLQINKELIVGAINSIFPPETECITTDSCWHTLSDGSCFELHCTRHLMSVCSKGVNAEILNQIIDIALSGDGILYDPQTGVRYDGKSRENKRGIFYKAKPKRAVKLKDDWIECPGCGFRLQTTNKPVWEGHRHKRCGQNIIF